MATDQHYYAAENLIVSPAVCCPPYAEPSYQIVPTKILSLQDRFHTVNVDVKNLLTANFFLKKDVQKTEDNARLLYCKFCHQGPEGYSQCMNRRGEYELRPYTTKNQPSTSIAEAMRHLYNHHPSTMYGSHEVFVCPYDFNCISQVSAKNLYAHRSLMHPLSNDFEHSKRVYPQFLKCACGAGFSTYHGYAKHVHTCGYYKTHIIEIFDGNVHELIYMG